MQDHTIRNLASVRNTDSHSHGLLKASQTTVQSGTHLGDQELGLGLPVACLLLVMLLGLVLEDRKLQVAAISRAESCKRMAAFGEQSHDTLPSSADKLSQGGRRMRTLGPLVCSRISAWTAAPST